MRASQKALLAIFLAALFDLSPAGAATVERLETGRSDLAIFLLNGLITGGETIALQRQISRLPSSLPVAVILNSPGGNLAEGVTLGRFFYAAKIPTFVRGYGGICYSACSLAFLGGRDRLTGKPARFKMSGGNLGFHQFSVTRTEENKAKIYKKADVDNQIKWARSVTFALINYLISIHEDMSKLHLMLQSPADKITLVSNEQAIALGIHVMLDDGDDFIAATAIQERVNAP